MHVRHRGIVPLVFIPSQVEIVSSSASTYAYRESGQADKFTLALC